MAAMAHEHHAVHPSDLDVLDAVTMGHAPPLQHQHRHSHASRRSSSSSVASSSSQLLNSRNGAGHVQQGRRRPLDTLQALRRPPIDPIVLAASLSSGPQVTRHHFLHSFGPKQQSRQMTRSEHIRRQQEDEAREAHRLRIEEEAMQSGQRPSTSSLKGNNASKFRPRAGSYANCDADDVAAGLLGELAIVDEASAYRSRQAPRSARLEVQKEHEERKAALRRQKEEEKAARQARYEQGSAIGDRGDDRLAEGENSKVAAVPAQDPARLSPRRTREKRKSASAASLLSAPGSSSLQQPPPLEMRCMARTRVPTPHGEVFCHIYTNNRDNKEHLALVIDPEQNSPRTTAALEQGRAPSSSGFIRSRTLDAKWPGETDMDRIVRGAYVGRLSSSCQLISAPVSRETGIAAVPTSERPEAPLVRIHSECYTGETIGSQRCDCGEQLDEAIRLIHAGERPVKGVVVYLRQEGRGIGLLNKIMAYNLQDMGHDTVNANIMLGHLADARKYDIAAEILRDLNIPECQLLTNNPEKIDALEAEGIRVVKRVPMVPRIWRLQDMNRPRRRKHSHRHRHTHKQGGRAQHKKDSTSNTASSLVKTSGSRLESSIISQFEDGAKSTDDTGSPAIDELDVSDVSSASESDSSQGSYNEHVQRRAGATMVGASSTRGPELEKYLRTKIERMGHMLDVPPEELAKVASKLSGKSERSASQSRASAPLLAHLTDDKGAVPQSIEGSTEDQADDAASHDDYSYDVHDMPRSVELCATDSAPGTASDSEHANVHSHDFAESPSEGDNDEDDDDQILVNAPGDAKK